jgi:sugar phosphate isomerase/epimerase
MLDRGEHWVATRRHCRAAAALAAALLVGGCASVAVDRYVRPERGARAARTAADVVLLDEAPASPNTALARIEVRDRGLGRSVERLRRKLASAAAELGADAVVLEPTTTRRSIGGSPYPIGLYDDRVVAGTAIVHEPPSDAG